MVAGGGHISFAASDCAAVHNFFASAIEAGGKYCDRPARRHDGHRCFNAAVLDFDGNSIEVIYHEESGISDDVLSHRPSIAYSCQHSLTENVNSDEITPDIASLSNIRSSTNTVLGMNPKRAIPENTGVSTKSTMSSIHDSITKQRDAGQSLTLGTDKVEISTKTLAGAVLGAAAGAAVAYAICKSKDDSACAERDASAAASRHSKLELNSRRLLLPLPATPSHTPASSQCERMSRPPVYMTAGDLTEIVRLGGGRRNATMRAIENNPMISEHGSPATTFRNAGSANTTSSICRAYSQRAERRTASITSKSHHERSIPSSLVVKSPEFNKPVSQSSRSTVTIQSTHSGSSRNHLSRNISPGKDRDSLTKSRSSETSRKTKQRHRAGRTSTEMSYDLSQKAAQSKISMAYDSGREELASLPGDHLNFLQSNESHESVTPSDSISCVGSVRRSKTQPKSDLPHESVAESQISKRSKRSTRSKTVPKLPKVCKHATDDDDQTITPRSYKVRSVVSLPVRRITRSMIMADDRRVNRSHIG